jgi:hypothetical protein
MHRGIAAGVEQVASALIAEQLAAAGMNEQHAVALFDLPPTLHLTYPGALLRARAAQNRKRDRDRGLGRTELGPCEQLVSHHVLNEIDAFTLVLGELKGAQHPNDGVVAGGVLVAHRLEGDWSDESAGRLHDDPIRVQFDPNWCAALLVAAMRDCVSDGLAYDPFGQARELVSAKPEYYLIDTKLVLHEPGRRFDLYGQRAGDLDTTIRIARTGRDPQDLDVRLAEPPFRVFEQIQRSGHREPELSGELLHDAELLEPLIECVSARYPEPAKQRGTKGLLYL